MAGPDPETVFDAFLATAAADPGLPFLCVPPASERAYHPEGVEYSYEQTRLAVLDLLDWL